MPVLIQTAQIRDVEADTVEIDDTYPGTYGFAVTLDRDPGPEWGVEFEAVYEGAPYPGKPPARWDGDRLRVYYLPRYADDLPRYLRFLRRVVDDTNKAVEQRNAVVPNEDREKAAFLEQLRAAAKSAWGRGSKGMSVPSVQYADLHAHTTASDGTFTPTELVQTAQQKGLTYLAVTDHDTLGGLPEAIAATRGTGIRLIPGVELSAEGSPGKCHLLGLGIDPVHKGLIDTLAQLSANRRARNAKMADRLTALGMPITLDEVTAIAPPGANVGRPHFAATLLAKGYVRDTREAFEKYLGDDAAAYVTKATLTPAEAIRLVHDAGGLCFLAHPGLLKLASQETFETRATALKAVGLDGLEAFYSAYSPALSEQFVRLAAKLNLLVTGGSDFHGANRPEAPLGLVRDGHPLPADLLPSVLLAHAR